MSNHKDPLDWVAAEQRFRSGDMDSLELSEWFLLGARGAAEIDTLIRVYEEVCTARIHPDDVDRIDRTQDRELERLSGTYSRLVELIRKE